LLTCLLALLLLLVLLLLLGLRAQPEPVRLVRAWRYGCWLVYLLLLDLLLVVVQLQHLLGSAYLLCLQQADLLVLLLVAPWQSLPCWRLLLLVQSQQEVDQVAVPKVA
jgi:hypothetical protein